MPLLHSLLSALDKVRPASPVEAHCDVPCGIYDPFTAKLAARTVLKMVEKIGDLKGQEKADRNSFVRMVMTKEEHSQICKKELLILWTDYFKPEHLSMFPNLHQTFWKAAKLCSRNKQEISLEAAQELLRAVEEIEGMFRKAEEAKKK